VPYCTVQCLRALLPTINLAGITSSNKTPFDTSKNAEWELLPLWGEVLRFLCAVLDRSIATIVLYPEYHSLPHYHAGAMTQVISRDSRLLVVLGC